MKSTLYLTARVLQGNKIDLQHPNIKEGQTVEIVIIIPASDTSVPSFEEQPISLEERRNFLKLPLDERRRILTSQAEAMVSHYEQNSEWQELMAGDIIEY